MKGQRTFAWKAWEQYTMLAIRGSNTKRSAFCDGVSRRDFLKIGVLGMGGLALPELLRAEAQAGIKRSHKAVIMIFLPGGPSHQDTFDLKPDAPAEFRGEFKPIDTNVSGIQICELLPQLARRMDKCALLRSIVGASGRHDAVQCFTGRNPNNAPAGGWPSLGSTLSKLQGAVDPGIPPFVGLTPSDIAFRAWSDPGSPGFLGVSHAPFRPSGAGKEDMVLDGITLDRLGDRRQLLASFDRFRRDVDASGMMAGLDSFNEQAYGLLTSSKLLSALDLANEDPRVVERYGKGDARYRDDGAPKLMSQFLVARRLVEAGARCVTLAFSRWDHHGGNFNALRQDLPLLDQGVSALIDDIHSRGLDKDVSVVVWGEMGRTPTINPSGGRDHWPNVTAGLLFGGGMRVGQVIGSTDRCAGAVKDRPLTFGDVFATLYHNLGIDPTTTTVPDLTGRPQYLVENGSAPIKELV